MRINRVETEKDAWQIAEQWRELADGEPMLSPDWLLPWWSNFSDKGELFVLQVLDHAGETIGIAPLYLRNVFGVNRIQMLGDGLVCSDYLRWISRPELNQVVSDLIVEYLSKYIGSFGAFRSFEMVFEGVQPQSSESSQMLRSLEARGYRARNRAIESSYRIQLPSTWEGYLATLDSSPRRKARKILSRFDSGELNYQFSVEHEDVLLRLPELIRLHQLRRGALGQPGCYAEPRFERFIRHALPLLAERGMARMEWCTHNDATIAIHLVLTGKNTTYMYQSGVDPNRMDLEPGHALSVLAIRQAIREQRKCYDFLRGNEKYKAFWGGVEEPLATLRVSPPQTLSRFVGFTNERLWNLKQTTKDVVRFVRSLSASSPSSK